MCVQVKRQQPSMAAAHRLPPRPGASTIPASPLARRAGMASSLAGPDTWPGLHGEGNAEAQPESIRGACGQCRRRALAPGLPHGSGISKVCPLFGGKVQAEALTPWLAA